MTPVKVATMAALDDGELMRVDVDGTPVVLARVGEDVYALCDTCSHAEASLSEGELYPEDLEIECPLHASTFDLRTGEPNEPPATEPVARYAVTVEGDDILVDVR